MRVVAGCFAVAACLLVGGACLVGWWMVGVVLMIFGLAVAAVPVLFDLEREPKGGLPADHPLERFRRAP